MRKQDFKCNKNRVSKMHRIMKRDVATHLKKVSIFLYLCVGKSAVGFNSQKTFLSIISSGEST